MRPEDRWTDPDWLSRAHAWIDDRLAELGRSRTGEVEQPHVRSWGTVLRVPTARGPVWFKAPGRALRHEGAVHAVVSSRRPDRVPPLLAHDPQEGWMLSADAGRRLREVLAEERDLGRWHDVLTGCAQVQLACEPDVAALLAAGAPHRPLAALPEELRGLLARTGLGSAVDTTVPEPVGLVAEQVARLATYGMRESVQHDDLHDAQVFVPEPIAGQGAPHLILDWGDAVVTHPFTTLAVTLIGVVAFGLDDVTGSVDVAPFRDSYLGPYADAYGTSVADLREAADLGARLGWASRAVHVHDDDAPAKTEQRLRMWATGRP